MRRQRRPPWRRPHWAFGSGRRHRPATRAAALERAAERLEAHRGELLALLQTEGGKTLDDALAEWREAVDYCRYYAAQARRALADAPMPGPTGESNVFRYRGRGVFRLHQSVEFSAGDLSRPGQRRARRRQRRGRQARRADAACRRSRRRAAARSRHSADGAAACARRRQGRRQPGRRSARRRRRLHRLDRSRPRHQSARLPGKAGRSCR